MTAAWIIDFLNRRAKVEQEMLDAAKWIVIERPDRALDAEQLRDWALRLGVPEDPGFGRAVAAQPTDLRALLQEALSELTRISPNYGKTKLGHLLHAALAEPASEPFATIYEMQPKDRSSKWLSLNPMEENSIAVRAIAVYTAQPPASPSDARDLPCGHPISCNIRSAEMGEILYCGWCNSISFQRDLTADAERERDTLKALLKEAIEGFSRVLVGTSDHERVYGWVKRVKTALAAIKRDAGRALPEHWIPRSFEGLDAIWHPAIHQYATAFALAACAERDAEIERLKIELEDEAKEHDQVVSSLQAARWANHQRAEELENTLNQVRADHSERLAEIDREYVLGANERDVFRARLDSAQKQEPVAWQDLGATSAQGFLSVRDRKMETWDRPLYDRPLLLTDKAVFWHGIYPEGGAEMAQEMQRLREVIAGLRLQLSAHGTPEYYRDLQDRAAQADILREQIEAIRKQL